MAWCYMYVAVGCVCGAITFWRNSYNIDEELFALASSVAAFWPAWIVWDLCRWAGERRRTR